MLSVCKKSDKRLLRYKKKYVSVPQRTTGQDRAPDRSTPRQETGDKTVRWGELIATEGQGPVCSSD